MIPDNANIFRPLTFRKGLSVKNRIAMSPMTTWASNDDYTVSDEEVEYYRARVDGPGLIITGCTRVAPNGIGFTHEFASYDDSFLPSLKKLAKAAKSGGSPAILQIYHAGNKAIPDLIVDGDMVSASAVPSASGSAIPRPLTHEEILDTIKAFGESTRRAIEAGFDGVELHGAHGFLLQNFFSPFYNQRNDQWGGSAENRMRFPIEVVREVQKVIQENAKATFLLGYRISPEETQPEGYKIKDTYPLIDRLIGLEVDYLHASLSNVLKSTPLGATAGKTMAALLVEHVGYRVPVIAAGQVRSPADAAAAIGLGLSLVAIGQGIVINPNWVALAVEGKKIDVSLSLSKLPELSIPKKLLNVIDTTHGWFQMAK